MIFLRLDKQYGCLTLLQRLALVASKMLGFRPLQFAYFELLFANILTAKYCIKFEFIEKL
jgi:hypothetical protein